VSVAVDLWDRVPSFVDPSPAASAWVNQVTAATVTPIKNSQAPSQSLDVNEPDRPTVISIVYALLALLPAVRLLHRLLRSCEGHEVTQCIAVGGIRHLLSDLCE
jgi:hypothetical protein